jgi:hypothetical protein
LEGNCCNCCFVTTDCQRYILQAELLDFYTYKPDTVDSFGFARFTVIWDESGTYVSNWLKFSFMLWKLPD